MPERKPGDWDCPDCSHVNFAWRKECEYCPDAKRPRSALAAASRPGDWTCTECGNLNFKFRMACHGCRHPKPSSGKNGPPMWWCRTCRFDIYPSKDKCGKCETPRPQRFPDLKIANVMSIGASMFACTACQAIVHNDHGPTCPSCRRTFTCDQGATPGVSQWTDTPLTEADREKEHLEKEKQRQEKEALERQKRKRELEDAALDDERRRVQRIEAKAALDRRVLEAAAVTVDLDPTHDVESDPECKICMTFRIALTFYPCQHACVCRTCYAAMTNPKSCPICRGPVRGAINARF